MGDLRIHKRKSNDNDSPKLIHIDIKIPEKKRIPGFEARWFYWHSEKWEAGLRCLKLGIGSF